MKARSVLQTPEGVLKRTDDSIQQVKWLRTVEKIGTVKGIRAAKILKEEDGNYLMEYVPGPTLADFLDEVIVSSSTLHLLEQIDIWALDKSDNNATWAGYLDRLHEHARSAHSSTAVKAIEVVSAGKPFPPSWCHGDLTLENVLVHETEIVLIDPNYHPDLYQSYMLDYGKLLQSTHTSYHEFVSPRRGNIVVARELVENHLRQSGEYHDALRACLSHVVRLLKHWPAHFDAIETIIEDLMHVIDRETSNQVTATR